ncbi:glycosyltransferase family 4 protein [Colwellia sp. UCD-KL20]|uniref:glycosyltransferase family 4 protein n=1 Tax=Colwellia sp. UCD-KL20 TaxID=1917165 RepID=UPI00097037ED|nr:glycosyltransferase family 4 protein [Colwellia sp. UCD-KL20]
MKNKITTISTKANGGIKSVVVNYEETDVFDNYEHVWLRSHEEGSSFFRVCIFIKCLFVLILSLIKCDRLFHIHMAMKGSFFRKMILVKLIKLFKGKVILHLHGSEFEVFYDGRGKFIQSLIRSTFLKVDVVIVLSKSWKKFILRVSESINVVVVPNFVKPIPKVESTTSNEGVVFIFLGALGKRKGIYDLLPAFKQHISKHPTSKLIVCGDGELDKVKALAKELDIQNSLEFPGWVNGAEKTALLNASDVVVLPSYNEGLPMVILEAMSLGKCVISTYVGGIPEAIKTNENGLLIEAGNIPELEAALSFSCLEEERTRLGLAGLSSFEQLYSPNIIVPEIKNIYESLL